MLAQMVAPLVSAAETARPVPIDRQCALLADKNWPVQEQFVWVKVCIGDTADLNIDKTYDPKIDEFPNSRIIRPSFIETILLERRYRELLTRRGITIIGARFDELLDLQNAELAHQISLESCQIKKGVNFSGLTSSFGISLSGSYIKSIDLSGTRIGRDLMIERAKVDRVGDGGPYEDDDDANLSMQLEGTSIQGSLMLGGAHVGGRLDAHTIAVGQAVYLNEGAQFDGSVNVTFSRIGESFNLANAVFKDNVDLTGTQIGADLNFGSKEDSDETKWVGGSNKMIMHNTRVEIIPALSDSWPPGIDISGLTYRSVDSSDSYITLPEIETWFAKQKYSAQSYEQLAHVFQNQGAVGTATNVRYASRDRVRQESAGLSRERAVSTALYLLIGYGYYPEQAIAWVALMVLAGVVVLAVSGQGQVNGLKYGIAYSFDMLLPIIRLREMHYKIDLKGPARYYFYFHRISGWILASFLIAGVSGLTK